MDPGQQVASITELMDKIYSYLDSKAVFRARAVCRQWRSMSKLYLKRRMSLINSQEGPLETSTVAVYLDVQKASNLLSNTFPASKRPSIITLKPSVWGRGWGDNWVRHIWPHPSAPLIAIVLDQDWTATIESLKLDLCLTINDLLAIQVAILKRFSSLRAFYAELLESRSTVVALCYAELQDRSGQEDFQNYSLKKFQVRGCLSSFKYKKAGSLDGLVYDLFAACPNLYTFKLGLFERSNNSNDDLSILHGHGPESYFRSDMWAEGDGIEADFDFTITRSNHPNRVCDDAMQVEPYWAARLISCHGNFGLALSSLLSVILSLTQFQKLWISLKHSVVAKVCRNADWLQDRLDILYLTSGYDCPLAMKALSCSAVFANVTRLYWSIAMLDPATFNLDLSAGDGPIFPNVVTLQLHRDHHQIPKRNPKDGAEADIWICRNIHKMAPYVRRLIVDVYNGELTERYRRWRISECMRVSQEDAEKMMQIAKDFCKLEHLVLINPANVGRKWTDLNPESAAACLKGLKSLTLSIDGHQMLVEAAKYFLRLCQQESLGSITKLGLYKRREGGSADSDDEVDEDPVLADLFQAGVAVPEHMIVTTGIWSREMALEAFEGPVEFL